MPQFWKKINISFWLAIGFILAFLVSPAMAGIVQVTTGSNDNTHPSIDNDNIVWIRNIGGKGQVFLYNLKSKSEVQITSNPVDHFGPMISGNTVVYFDVNEKIYSYDIVTKVETPILTSGNVELAFVYLSGQRVIWSEGQRSYIFDIPSKTKTEIAYPQVSFSQGSCQMVLSQISGDNLISFCESIPEKKTEIYLSNIFTGKTSLLVTINAIAGDFSFSGHRIAWTDYRNGEYTFNPSSVPMITSRNSDVYLYDLDTKTETRLTNDQANQSVFEISRDTLWYLDDRTGVAGELVAYNIPTSSETRISTTILDYYQLFPSQASVSDDKIVFWRKNDAKVQPGSNIFLYSPSIPEGSPSEVPGQQKPNPTKTDIPAIVSLSGFTIAVFILSIFKRRS